MGGGPVTRRRTMYIQDNSQPLLLGVRVLCRSWHRQSPGPNVLFGLRAVLPHRLDPAPRPTDAPEEDPEEKASNADVASRPAYAAAANLQERRLQEEDETRNASRLLLVGLCIGQERLRQEEAIGMLKGG